MFKLIGLRLSVLFVLEFLSFFVLNHNSFNIDYLMDWFLLWSLISFVLLSKNLVNLGTFSPLRMVGGNQQVQNLAGEASERMFDSYKKKYRNNLKLNYKHLPYLICLLINLIVYFVFKLFF
ncbi:hypothetical protein [Paramaledivibacter caminithermalis]|jgi:hypothetical protein|uniref:DUF3899 domain-containing protein n=1 Tax=Paramaledivibacter caminithermalis (strain DSM 15212 / CIP 107654 / DViRD3) TaxID=1121301 RepID=A0A1M6U4I2_PARC5|nr:hypothetical protein [Paramaledivibacter caminithermalis]SHK64182.1 hypothetical protein SAMN02745912_03871 [Paramaledivibacter caminithermalis DSM 15212]